MSYKSRVLAAQQELLRCSVKDVSGPNKKIVAMAYETYLTISKEYMVEILGIIQAGDPAAYADRLKMFIKNNHPNAILPSRRPEWQKSISSQKGNAKPANPSEFPSHAALGRVPEPPAINKIKMEGESDKDFKVRRMKEGKAYKAWERNHAEAYARQGTAQPGEAGIPTGNVTEGEAAQVSAAEVGTPGHEAASGDEVPDPIKEAIEQASMDQLMGKQQQT